jgi:hypothetical protein
MGVLEAASVVAFEYLSHDLAALNVPNALLRAIERAKRDEVRHTAMMTSLAVSERCNVKIPDIADYAPRKAIAIAIENAVEGCVRETFGALVAEWQSRHAEHAALRLAMRTIARDERRHAALSWTIDAWLDERLSAGERDQVADAVRTAVTALKHSTYFDFGADVLRALGLPNRQETAALLDTLESQLWLRVCRAKPVRLRRDYSWSGGAAAPPDTPHARFVKRTLGSLLAES